RLPRDAGKRSRLLCQTCLHIGCERAGNNLAAAQKSRFDAGRLAYLPHGALNGNATQDISQQRSILIAAEIEWTYCTSIERAAINQIALCRRGQQGLHSLAESIV